MIAVIGGAAYLLANPQPGFLSKLPWPSKWDWGWFSSKSAATSTAAAPAKPPAVATKQIMLGVPTPGAKSDRLFSLILPTGEIKESQVSAGWRTTELLRLSGPTIVDQKKSDGVMFLKSGISWSVPLRDAKGNPYDQATLLGMFDADHAAVMARSQEQVVLSVSKNNEIREAAVITEDLNPLVAGQGAAWFSSFMPGEGIESPPHGPSNLIKIGRDGTSQSVATEPNVIVAAVLGPTAAYAYQIDDGGLHAVSGQGDLRRDGRPLLWLDDQHLLFAQGVTLYQWSATSSEAVKVGDLAAAPSVAALSK